MDHILRRGQAFAREQPAPHVIARRHSAGRRLAHREDPRLLTLVVACSRVLAAVVASRTGGHLRAHIVHVAALRMIVLVKHLHPVVRVRRGAMFVEDRRRVPQVRRDVARIVHRGAFNNGRVVRGASSAVDHAVRAQLPHRHRVRSAKARPVQPAPQGALPHPSLAASPPVKRKPLAIARYCFISHSRFTLHRDNRHINYTNKKKRLSWFFSKHRFKKKNIGLPFNGSASSTSIISIIIKAML